MVKLWNWLLGRKPAAGGGRIDWLSAPGGLSCVPFDDEDDLIQIPYRSPVVLEIEVA